MSQMIIAKSSKWQATQPRNAFFLSSIRVGNDMMAALRMMILTSVESSGALPRLTWMTNMSPGEVSGVIADKTATLKNKL